MPDNNAVIAVFPDHQGAETGIKADSFLVTVQGSEEDSASARAILESHDVTSVDLNKTTADPKTAEPVS